MNKLLVACLILSSAFGDDCPLGKFTGTLSARRDDIINEYQPILLDKSANLTSEAVLIDQESNLIIAQIKNDTWTTVALMNTQIAGIKTTIANAKAAAANKTSALACIGVQETAAAKLTPVPINATCWVGGDFTEMTGATADFHTLAKVPNATIPSCGALDPLSSQDELFLDCITSKIFDLDTQIALLKGGFVEVKDNTLRIGIQCLADQSSLLAQQINEINFQVTLCLSLS